MFTSLLALIVALALGHISPGATAALRRFTWFGRAIGWHQSHSGETGFWHSRYGAVLALLPPLLILGLLQWFLKGTVLGLPSLLLGVAVLAWTWGPRDLDRDVEAVIDADDRDSRHEAISHLQSGGGSLREDVHSLVSAVVINALRRWFGVLFWFLLLGPFGALLYRLTTLLVEGKLAGELPAENLAGARRLLAAMEWPVAQLMTLSMALVGNFDAVLRSWRENHGLRWSLEPVFLAAVARAAVNAELRDEAGDYIDAGLIPVWQRLPELRDAMSLIWRVLLLWMVLMALAVIAGWIL